MAFSDTNFSGALATWKNIQLSELQRTLDAQGIEVVDNQKESMVGRKALADKTKEFKKIPDEDKLTAFKGLLKSYQTEIDSLTKRSKTAENAFLNVYKVLAEAPDPYPLLEAAVDQAVRAAEAAEFEAELKRLRDENAELKRRVGEVSALEAAKKKAETRVEQLEAKMEESIEEKVAQKQNELNATYDERIQNSEQREQDLQKQLNMVKGQLRELRMSNDTTQAKLLDHSQRQDHEVVAKLAELDMVVADLEHANSRVATVERRNELLRAEIEAIRSGSDTSSKVKELEKQISDLESEAAKLSQSLENHKLSASNAAANANKRLDEISRELQSKNTELDQVKQKLRQYSDYDEIKRELEIMKYVEFAGFDDDDDDSDDASMNGYDVHLPNPNAEKANSHQGKSLEALLALKNKRILEELTRFRILHEELETSLRTAEERLATADAELDKQHELNERLENDLLEMDRHKGKREDGAASRVDSSDVLADLDLGGASEGAPARSSPIPFASNADASILPIVTSQRDRFRQRNAELEDELRRQFQTLTELRAEVKSLQADNLKLYEKVRYMQSYQGQGAGSKLPVTNGTAAKMDNMATYQEQYEASMNPFQAFRGREVARAYQSLNAVERGVLTVTRGILGNRRTRIFFICYSLALHLLVMFTTYECTTTSGTQLATQPGPYS